MLLLAATLAFAVVRPRGLPEAVAAVPAALLVVALGILPARAALDELGRLGPTIGFLAAVLVLAELCEREGLFATAGRRMAATARGRPVALLGLVFLVGSAVTAVLSRDATVVLLTPVVFASARACKVALIATSAAGGAFGLPVPFAPIQIVVLELFMDVAASATFVAEHRRATL